MEPHFYKACASEAAALILSTATMGYLLSPINPFLGIAVGAASTLLETITQIALIQIAGVEWTRANPLVFNLISKGVSLIGSTVLAVGILGAMGVSITLGLIALIVILLCVATLLSTIARTSVKLFSSSPAPGISYLFQN